jgi:hypothetical protein
LLVKKQAKALKAIRKNFNKAALLLRKAPVLSKVGVVVPWVENKASRTTSRSRAYKQLARYNNNFLTSFLNSIY